MAPLNVNLQSENEEIISIYQRPAELSLKVPEDFDVFSMDDHELQVSYYSLVIVNGSSVNPRTNTIANN